MFIANRRNLDSWSTDNCCVKWSLRGGTLFIAVVSVIWLGMSASWFIWMTFTCWGIYLRNCTVIPEPERHTVTATTSKDYDFDVDIVLCLLSLFFTLYFILSVLVIIGTLKEIPKLLQGWVYCTMCFMILIFADLLITLAFTNILHLVFCVSVFILSLYNWAVVRSHMNAIILSQNAIPLPDNAVKEYTVHGMPLDSLEVEVKVS